jgi:hypothetical protein
MVKLKGNALLGAVTVLTALGFMQIGSVLGPPNDASE